MPRTGDCVELWQVEREVRLEFLPAWAFKQSHAINASFLPQNTFLKAPPQVAVDIELLLERSVLGVPLRFCVIPEPI